MYKKLLLTLLIVMALLSSSTTFAVNEWDEEHEFYPVDFLFCYNDHNSTTYEGDRGLSITYCNNTMDNKTYTLGADEVRSIAYATKKSFKFNETIMMTHSAGKEPKSILKMWYKNGTIIPELSLDSNSLTNEQLSYFDDYYNQRKEYIENRQYWQQSELQDSLDDLSYKDSKSDSKYHAYYGTNGYGIMVDY
ncbi:MAG: hypothetical protein BZ135_00360 [Methanosphaera sp. rholeuAM6]|nr:MAG: hypothetical protein BZ135_00360 [Methanosphaera sp. rholeuAM6]